MELNHIYLQTTLRFTGTVTSVSDYDILQQGLNYLTNLDLWSRNNNIKFNSLKCKVLSMTRTKTPIFYDYYLSAEKLRVEEEKLLGVTYVGLTHKQGGVKG
jgi:hypothetical protein